MTNKDNESLIAEYTSGSSIEQLALKYDRPIKSVRATLVRQGVYVKKAVPIKKPKLPTKAEVVTIIARQLNLPECQVESLEKAKLPALLEVAKQLGASINPT